jgi:uncharacterized protein (TIRG00374 family)
MAVPLAPRLLRRGLELFALISVVVFAVILLYGNNLEVFVRAMLTLQWGWVGLGVGIAAFDWVGGGLRLWVLLQHVHPTKLRHCIMSAGLNYWATLLTPSQAGGGPVGIYALKRYGTPIPEGIIATFMSWMATILFFVIAGPTAVALGAGRSLERHGVLGQAVSLNDLFRLALGGFIAVGIAVLLVIVFPGVARQIAQRIATWLEGRGSAKLAGWVAQARDGIDRSHEAMIAFFRGRGWISLLSAVLLTALALANKLLAGYVVLRALNIQAPFVDVVLLQTLLMFLLYFAPTPGSSGLAEVLSAAVMSIYVPRELTPSYVLLWRVFVGYLTLAVGSYVAWRWLKLAAVQAVEETTEHSKES